LQTRHGATSDAAEKDSINDQIVDLQAQRGLLNEADLAGSAQAVADATATLEASVKAAQAGPFDSFLSNVHTATAKLQTAHAELSGSNRLARTDVPQAPALAVADDAPAAGIPSVGASTSPAALAAEYQACFDICVPAEAQMQTIQWYCDRVLRSRTIYTSVGTPLGIPWYFVGLLHGMEASFNFGTHLHNGDPLAARTVHVPKGRPTMGNPPFTWSDSATDALTFEDFANQADWTLPRVLYRIEAFNGFGYRRNGIRTPYLWSFSNLYTRGKYVADGVFDPNAVSNQAGAAVVLKQLVASGVLIAQADGTLV
jgi:lysozyme family protein